MKDELEFSVNGVENTESPFMEVFKEKDNNSSQQLRRNIFVYTKFDDAITTIGYVFLATNEEHIVMASNGRINLLQGRMYYIPINIENISSDDRYNIKIHSDVADRVDVRFIKDGFACVLPIRHNVTLKTGEKLCELIPF